LTHLPVLYTWGGCDQRPLAGGQLRFGNDPDQFARLFDEARSMIMNGPDDYRIGVAPHSLRAVDKSGLTAAIDLADGAPLHIHVAEQIAEVEEVEACFGARPVAWLLHEMPIDERWCLIHTTQMTAPETRELALSGAVAGLCPITEANLGDGIFNGARFLDVGGRFGIGTDSNVHIALFEELCALEYSQRLRDRGRAALALPGKSTGRTLFEAAASAGARAAGRDSGSLHEGCIADLLGISTNNAWLCDRTDDALLDSLIFSGRGRDCITDVWSAGRHVVRKGRHHNRATISGRFRRAMAELRKEV
jgi:formimidoylglutamate deiminase